MSTLQETWRELELLLDQEKIRSVGVSNFQVSDLEDLIDSMETSDTLPHVNQCEFHPCQNPEELVKFCLKNQIQVGTYPTIHEFTLFIGQNTQSVLFRGHSITT